MAKQKSLEQILKDIDLLIRNPNTPAEVRQALRDYISNGTIPPYGSLGEQAIQNVVRRSQWEGQPGRMREVLLETERQKKAADQKVDNEYRRQPETPAAAAPSAPGSVGQFAASLVGGLDPGDTGSGSSPYAGGARGGAADENVKLSQVSGAQTPQYAVGSGAATGENAAAAAGARAGQAAAAAQGRQSSPFGGGPSSPLTSTQASIIGNPQGQEQELMQRMALLREMGLDGSRLSAAGSAAADLMQSVLGSLGMALPFINGGDGMDRDVMTVAPQLQQFAKSLVTPGVNAFSQVRNVANQALQNPNLGQYLAGLSDSGQAFQTLSSLMGARLFGNSPLVQQSVSDQAKRNYMQYSLSDFDSGGAKGVFYDWLMQQPQATKSIYGLR